MRKLKKIKAKKTSQQAALMKIGTNLVLGVLILSVGTLCFAPTDTIMQTESQNAEIYRSSIKESHGVSLMFNVYWGEEEIPRILNTLKAHNAKATFFIGGCWADDHLDILKSIYAAGHEIGNHGYFHKDHAKLSYAENKKEIESCNQFLSLSLGISIQLFAPPSGAYGDTMLSACEALNMKTILWSRDTIDWRDKNASVIYTRATKDIKGGEFVLMHPMKETADALHDILNDYEKKNLTAITVSENLQLENKG